MTIDRALPLWTELKALFCVRNAKRRRLRVQVVGKDTTDKYTMRVELSV